MCARWTRDMVGVFRPVALMSGVPDDMSGDGFDWELLNAEVSIALG
jgi:hypothetical protein